jgi:hypothetical protein
MNNQQLLAGDFVDDNTKGSARGTSCCPSFLFSPLLSRGDINDASPVPGLSRKVVYSDEAASVVAQQMNEMSSLEERERAEYMKTFTGFQI